MTATSRYTQLACPHDLAWPQVRNHQIHVAKAERLRREQQRQAELEASGGAAVCSSGSRTGLTPRAAVAALLAQAAAQGGPPSVHAPSRTRASDGWEGVPMGPVTGERLLSESGRQGRSDGAPGDAEAPSGGAEAGPPAGQADAALAGPASAVGVAADANTGGLGGSSPATAVGTSGGSAVAAAGPEGAAGTAGGASAVYGIPRRDDGSQRSIGSDGGATRPSGQVLERSWSSLNARRRDHIDSLDDVMAPALRQKIRQLLAVQDALLAHRSRMRQYELERARALRFNGYGVYAGAPGAQEGAIMNLIGGALGEPSTPGSPLRTTRSQLEVAGEGAGSRSVSPGASPNGRSPKRVQLVTEGESEESQEEVAEAQGDVAGPPLEAPGSPKRGSTRRGRFHHHTPHQLRQALREERKKLAAAREQQQRQQQQHAHGEGGKGHRKGQAHSPSQQAHPGQQQQQHQQKQLQANTRPHGVELPRLTPALFPPASFPSAGPPTARSTASTSVSRPALLSHASSHGSAATASTAAAGGQRPVRSSLRTSLFPRRRRYELPGEPGDLYRLCTLICSLPPGHTGRGGTGQHEDLPPDRRAPGTSSPGRHGDADGGRSAVSPVRTRHGLPLHRTTHHGGAGGWGAAALTAAMSGLPPGLAAAVLASTDPEGVAVTTGRLRRRSASPTPGGGSVEPSGLFGGHSSYVFGGEGLGYGMGYGQELEAELEAEAAAALELALAGEEDIPPLTVQLIMDLLAGTDYDAGGFVEGKGDMASPSAGLLMGTEASAYVLGRERSVQRQARSAERVRPEGSGGDPFIVQRNVASGGSSLPPRHNMHGADAASPCLAAGQVASTQAAGRAPVGAGSDGEGYASAGEGEGLRTAASAAALRAGVSSTGLGHGEEYGAGTAARVLQERSRLPPENSLPARLTGPVGAAREGGGAHSFPPEKVAALVGRLAQQHPQSREEGDFEDGGGGVGRASVAGALSSGPGQGLPAVALPLRLAVPPPPPAVAAALKTPSARQLAESSRATNRSHDLTSASLAGNIPTPGRAGSGASTSESLPNGVLLANPSLARASMASSSSSRSGTRRRGTGNGPRAWASQSLPASASATGTRHPRTPTAPLTPLLPSASPRTDLPQAGRHSPSLPLELPAPASLLATWSSAASSFFADGGSNSAPPYAMSAPATPTSSAPGTHPSSPALHARSGRSLSPMPAGSASFPRLPPPGSPKSRTAEAVEAVEMRSRSRLGRSGPLDLQHMMGVDVPPMVLQAR